MEAAFDSYFRAADLDRDGRISGQEAVAFFKGSGLPQPVLAQVRLGSPHTLRFHSSSSRAMVAVS
jgi:hypothetical protein